MKRRALQRLGRAVLTALLAMPGALSAIGPQATAPTPETNPHAMEAIGSVRQMYDGALSPELAVSTFRNIDRLFPVRRVPRSSTPLPIPRAGLSLDGVRFAERGRDYTLADFVEHNRVAALLVIGDGAIRHESYRFGNTERTRWMSMSIAKSITATLAGAALQQGRIGSLADPVTRYVPALERSAYAANSVRDVLMMASGVRWNETYTDPASDRRRLLEVQLAQRPGGALALMAALPRAAPPGSVHLYSTGETQIAGEVVRGATGAALADYLHERVWEPCGMEADATWWLDSPDGSEIGGSGFSATLRDYGRFGLFVLGGGSNCGEPVLPAGWAREAGSAQPLSDGSRPDYGYLWWTGSTAASRRDGAFAAAGIFGQHLYINPVAGVVIVVWSALQQPVDSAAIDAWPLFDAITAELRRQSAARGA